jgi:iron complex outermembrane receptor protein
VLDGVRLSENELLNAVLSGIPVDSVERIEITRGGASVLYGDGATGGVINIVTKRPGKVASSGSVFVEGGRFNAGEVRVSGAQAWNGFAADATLGTQRTDNYRDNNEFKQTHFSGGAQWYANEGTDRVGFRYEGARQDMRFAGSLTEAQFNANPRQTLTPDDNGSLDYDRLSVFGQYRLFGHDVAADLSYRKKTVESTYVFGGFRSTLKYDSKQLQFSPRVRRLGAINGMINEMVAGVDLIKWERTTASFPAADAEQTSKAIYLRDELRFDAAHEGRISAGVRRELFDKDFSDPLGYATTGYNVNQGLNAWELQVSYMPVAHVTVFGKAGQSYRVANADENAATPINNQPLVPQKSHDAELGVSYTDAYRKITGRVFRHNLSNEIFYDPTLGFGANTNLDPTRRQGFELDAEQRIAADWNVSAHYQHVQAKFTEGVNDGKQIVLVPKNTLTARLSWATANQSADIGAQWVDSQRYGSDFGNICPVLIPAYTTLDARYARKLGQWELAVSGLNLADKHYYSQAYSCKDGANGGIYPSDGRQMKVSARYEF